MIPELIGLLVFWTCFSVSGIQHVQFCLVQEADEWDFGYRVCFLDGLASCVVFDDYIRY
ncbi:hypothetical protein CASFOL_037424 [Castilleja foliolosa]|uniref:Secreted protein n=1 Tax=Castilleja foliolosa TaxID=1961234 RepID=A0ABD3BNA9_9LAMI